MDRKDQPERTDFYGMMKADIDLYKCSRCGTCLRHCRFHAIEVAGDGAYYVNIPACEGCGVCAEVCPDNVVSMREAVAGELMLYREGAVFSTAKLRMGSGNSGKLVTEVKKQLQRTAPDAAFTVIDGSPGSAVPSLRP
jgi:MinD superfamily P-loop ATPase